jgi:hypothetical protein
MLSEIRNTTRSVNIYGGQPTANNKVQSREDS